MWRTASAREIPNKYNVAMPTQAGMENNAVTGFRFSLERLIGFLM